jgi:hypothetical protein
VGEEDWVGDFGQSHDWSRRLKSHLDQFRQGHVITDIPVFFANLGADDLWNQPRRLISTGSPEIVAEPDGVVHRAIVLTQGCDIVRPNTPWVTVAPVYDATKRLNPGQRGSAKGGQTWHLVHITASWADDGFWVADLRLELPVEKTLLLARTPLDGFRDEVGYGQFAERLGARKMRADVPNDVLDHVRAPLFEAVRLRADRGISLNEGVREIRIQLDDPFKPARVVVFVVANDGASLDIEEWEAVISEIYPHAAEHGITVLGPEVMSLDDMTARDYITSKPIADDS